MRIIILNQFFYPDHSATSQLMTDLAESLVERGIEVTAICGRGRYNGGEKFSKRELYKGIKIERAWSTSFGKKNLLGRLADYASFYLGACWKLLILPRHDLVVALTTPPLIGLIALIVGHMRGMRVVALVQDLYPEVAVALGALSPKGLLTKILERLSRAALSGSDRIIVLSECMRERVIDKIGEAYLSRIDVIHNWADGDVIKPIDGEPNSFSAEHKLEGRFVVLFSGNFGRVNEFATVLEAARLLRDRDEILFLFIGEGAKLEDIIQFSKRHNLTNIRVLPYQPREMIRYTLASSGVALVTLARGLAGLSVPSKAYAIMAAGRPLLFVGDTRSEIARLISETGCGRVVSADDSHRLASVIGELAERSDMVGELGARARQLFESRFDRPRAVAFYVETFSKCLKDRMPHTNSKALDRKASLNRSLGAPGAED